MLVWMDFTPAFSLTQDYVNNSYIMELKHNDVCTHLLRCRHISL